jgi:hypothetical protein
MRDCVSTRIRTLPGRTSGMGASTNPSLPPRRSSFHALMILPRVSAWARVTGFEIFTGYWCRSPPRAVRLIQVGYCPAVLTTRLWRRGIDRVSRADRKVGLQYLTGQSQAARAGPYVNGRRVGDRGSGWEETNFIKAWAVRRCFSRAATQTLTRVVEALFLSHTPSADTWP